MSRPQIEKKPIRSRQGMHVLTRTVAFCSDPGPVESLKET
jgi:hypothetical protein